MKPFKLWAVVNQHGHVHDVYTSRLGADMWATSLEGKWRVVRGKFVPDKEKP